MFRYSVLSRSVLAALGLVIAGTASAQNLINSNTTIRNSLCVGSDCATSESYGADTIRLKENNLRIHFDDTSTASAFPRNDWRILINDQSNGGGSYFAIRDLTAGRTIATFEAGAPSNAFYLDDGGRLGLGTSTPTTELHVSDGDTPTLRLEQNSSSGFSSQIWDVAGNETSFFVRDATNGSTLPFRIRPGAASQSLVIDSDDDIGIGVLSPSAQLEVVADQDEAAIFRGNGNKLMFLQSEDDNSVQIRLQSDSVNRRIQALNSNGDVQSQIIFRDDEMRFAGAAGTIMTMNSSGIVTDIGSCTTANPCDGVFDPTVYDVPSIDDHAAAMWKNKFLPAVGPTKNGPVNLNVKLTGMLNELEHAHIYIEQLHDRVAALETKLAQD